MVRRHRFLWTILACSVGLGVLANAIAFSPAPIPRIEHIVATWIGYVADGSHEFYRLELNADGSGFLSTSYYASPARLYRVRNWTLKEQNIDIPLEPMELHAPPIQLRGTASENGQLAWLRLTLTELSTPRPITRDLRLLREKDVIRDMELTGSRIGAEKGKKK